MSEGGEVHLVAGLTTHIGRGRKNQVRLATDKGVSRDHCTIVRRGDRWFVMDRGSARGTLVNGMATAGQQRLRDGDTLQIGATALTFRCDVADPGGPDGPLLPLHLGDTPAGAEGFDDWFVD